MIFLKLLNNQVSYKDPNKISIELSHKLEYISLKMFYQEILSVSYTTVIHKIRGELYTLALDLNSYGSISSEILNKKACQPFEG